MIRRIKLAGATALLGLLVVTTPVLGALTTISGYAYGEYVNVTLLNLANVTSGPLPTAGPFNQNSNFSAGPTSAASACVFSVPLTCNLLSTGVLTVATAGTVGPTGSVHSTASVNTVNALSGLVTGTTVASECRVDSNGATSGSSTLTNVQVNNITVASNPGPNTQVVLLDAGNVAAGYVVLNEQIYNATTNTLEVNAIHIYLTGGSLGTGDIIIAHVECDALPAGPAPVIPESPLAILLPLSALLVGGGILLLVMRRQQTQTLQLR